MRFVGKVWRLLVAVKDGLVLLFMLLFFGLLYAMMSAAPTIPAGAKGALRLDLAGTIVEQPATPGPAELLAGGSSLAREYSRRELVAALQAAARDDRVQAVALDLDIFTGGGQVTLSEVGRALDQVRKANKPVIAYASSYTDDSYQLAAHASEIWLNPLGTVLVRGPGGTNLYYKGLLDRIGVTANVYKAGTYKAATEPFTRNDMSPEAREALQAVASSLWENWVDEVRRARPKAQIVPYIAGLEAQVTRANGDLARAAQAAGLVDRIGNRTQFADRIAEIVGTDNQSAPGSFKTIHFDPWARSNPAGDESGNIGILTVAGEIVDGEAGPGMAGGESVQNLLHRGLTDRELKALVVRVDSPGGSVLASEQIREAVLEAKARGLPVVVSMGSMAASGGYWVATAADHIFAEPGTITGSIGVFGVLPSFQGTLEKLGLGADGVKTTPLSGEPDVLRGPSPEVGRLVQMSVDNMYRRFIGLVAKARRMPIERVDAVGQGRIWDGGTARQLGLVDSFGSLDDAVAEAARRAKLDPKEAKMVYLEEPPTFMDELLAAWSTEPEDSQARDALSRIAGEPAALLRRALADAQKILSGPAMQARCLECGAMAGAPVRVAAPDPTPVTLMGLLFR